MLKFKSLTLANAQSGSADSTNWPLCIGLGYGPQSADVDFKDTNNGGVIRPDGYDIQFFSNQSLTTRLAAERVTYDGVNGKLEAWVKVPTLNGTGTGTDTVIYMGYGDPTITTDPNSDSTYGKTSTWANYQFVQHFTSGLTANDSSPNAYTGTVSGPTAGAGIINVGASFAGGTDVIDYSSITSFTRPISFELWTAPNGIVNKTIFSSNPITNFLIYMRFNGTQMSLYDNTDEYAFTVPNDSSQHHFMFAIDSSGNRLGTIDGVSASLTALTGTTSNPAFGTALKIGAGFIGSWTSIIDELRVSDTNRSVSWALASYNSQKGSSTFITWSAQQSASGRLLPALGVGN